MERSKLSSCWRWSVTALVLLVASPALAATFNPTTALEIQAALDSAAANGENDTIVIPAGTFLADDSGNSSFYYNSSEDFALTIQGAGAGSTILRRESGSSVLEVYNSTGAGTDLTLSGVTIEGAGGYGLANASGNGANLIVQDCEFSDNQINIFFIGGAATAELSGNSFSGGEFGLLLSLSNTTATVSNNSFEDISGSGSAIYISNAPTTLNLDGNTFRDNSSDSYGGALATVADPGPMKITNNVFSNNSSSVEAGAVNIPHIQSLVVIGNVFVGNTSTGSIQTGALYANFNESALFVNNTVTGNANASGVGGVTLQVDSTSDTIALYNNIIFGNTGSISNDVYVADAFGANGSPVTLSNNDLGEFFSVCEDDGGCTPDIARSENISEDPLFVDAAVGDLNLALGSPAIGAGSPSAPQLPAEDLLGRPLNDPPDMGALVVTGSLTVNPLSLNFGSVANDSSATEAIVITNDGSVPVTVTGMLLSDDDNYSLDVSDCGSFTPTLAPGENCEVLITFAPDGGGTFNSTLEVASDALDTPSIVVELLASSSESSGGCSLGAASPVSIYAAWILVPLLWGLRRFRK